MTITDAELKNLVERGYAYVAMPNIIAGFALNPKNPFYTHGWNSIYRPTDLVDDTVRLIAGLNNDMLYVLRIDTSMPPFLSGFTPDETVDIGEDSGTPATDTYEGLFRSTEQ